MGHDPGAARHGALQAYTGSRPLLPRQRRRGPEYHQHLQHQRRQRQCGASELRPCEGGRDGVVEGDCEGVGAGVRGEGEYGRFWTYLDEVDGGEGGGGVCEDAGWESGCVGDTGEAEGGEGGKRGGGVCGYSVEEAGDGDGGCERDFGGCEPVV